MGIVKYTGLKALTISEQEVLKKIVMKHAEKLDRYFKNYICNFNVNLHEVEGRPKYSFHVKVSGPSNLLSVDSFDWDLKRSVHKVMEKLLNEAEHRFHRYGQKQQKFHPKKASRGTDKRVKLKLRGRVKMA